MLSVINNMSAENAGRQLKCVTKEKGKAGEKLSSGYRINRSADDSAGLSISEKMRWQIRGLSRAEKNISDGISLVQVADGALNEVSGILNRLTELSVQAANDTNTTADRQAIQKEMDQLVAEADAIAYGTSFNGDIYPLLGGGTKWQPDPGAVSSLSGTKIIKNASDSGNTSKPYRWGVGSALFYADGQTIGAIGEGTAGALMQVTDGVTTVQLELNQNPDESSWTKTVNGDNQVIYAYSSGDIRFEIVQDITEYEEVDEVSQTGYSFYNVTYSFRNMGPKDLKFDFAVSIDPYTGYFGPGNPYKVNGAEGTAQQAFHGVSGKMELETPIVKVGGQGCHVVSRFSGDGIIKSPDAVMVYGDLNDGTGLASIWKTIDSGCTTLYTSGKGMHEVDEFYSVWNGIELSSGGQSALNVMHGIKYDVTPASGATGTKNEIWIQCGAKNGDGMFLSLVDARAETLGIDDLNVTTANQADEAIAKVDQAREIVNKYRTNFGSGQNRLEYAHAIAGNTGENTQYAESRIRDTDMVSMMVSYSMYQVLEQTGQAILAQANQNPDSVLQLLQ